jgi:hypothetical protein
MVRTWFPSISSKGIEVDDIEARVAALQLERRFKIIMTFRRVRDVSTLGARPEDRSEFSLNEDENNTFEGFDHSANDLQGP